MNALDNVKDHAREAASMTRRRLAEGQVEEKLHQTQEQMLAVLREQQQELQSLRKDLSRPQKSSGGFPWALILLAGAGYALYRSNPAVREKIQGLLNRADPGLQGNMTRAGDAVEGAASDLGQGQNPSDNLGKVAGETQRAGEKMIDHAKATLDAAQDQARNAADDVTRGSSSQTKGQA